MAMSMEEARRAEEGAGGSDDAAAAPAAPAAPAFAVDSEDAELQVRTHPPRIKCPASAMLRSVSAHEHDLLTPL